MPSNNIANKSGKQPHAHTSYCYSSQTFLLDHPNTAVSQCEMIKISILHVNLTNSEKAANGAELRKVLLSPPLFSYRIASGLFLNQKSSYKCLKINFGGFIFEVSIFRSIPFSILLCPIVT